jgi:hypothetical protein
MNPEVEIYALSSLRDLVKDMAKRDPRSFSPVILS